MMIIIITFFNEKSAIDRSDRERDRRFGHLLLI